MTSVVMDGYKELAAGQVVEFRFHAQKYESFDFVADEVVPVKPRCGTLSTASARIARDIPPS